MGTPAWDFTDLFAQTPGGWQVDPDHERAPARENPPGTHYSGSLRARSVVRAPDRHERHAVADILFRVRFSSLENGTQTAAQFWPVGNL